MRTAGVWDVLKLKLSSSRVRLPTVLRTPDSPSLTAGEELLSDMRSYRTSVPLSKYPPTSRMEAGDNKNRAKLGLTCSPCLLALMSNVLLKDEICGFKYLVAHYVTAKTMLNYLSTKIMAHTIIAERPVEGGQTAVARVSVVFLDTFPSILAMHSIAAAVTRASRLHPRCDLCPPLKVKCHPVDL